MPNPFQRQTNASQLVQYYTKIHTRTKSELKTQNEIKKQVQFHVKFQHSRIKRCSTAPNRSRTEKMRTDAKRSKKLTNCFLERSLLVMNFLVRMVTALSAMAEDAPKRMRGRLELEEGRRRRRKRQLSDLMRDDKRECGKTLAGLINSMRDGLLGFLAQK